MLHTLTALIILLTSFAGAHAADATDGADTETLRLYTLNCGEVKVLDANIMDDTDSYKGSLNLVASCYVIQNGNQYMLWDAGFNTDAIKGVTENDMFQPKVQETIPESLAKIDLDITDISKIGISHIHFDHIGQANTFKDAELLIGTKDFDTLYGNAPTPISFRGSKPFLSEWQDGENVKKVAGDLDVFGDGRVKILSAPGHTPGHKVLLINLKNTGPILLSGDLYHFNDNRKYKRLPDFNTNRADTLASFERIDRILENTGARMVIQHEPKDRSSMPKLPNYLD